MPSLTPNAAMRSHLDTQIAVLAELSRKSYDTARRLNELNLALTRDLLDDFYSVSRQMLSATDPVQLSALMAGQMQPFGERMRSYAQQLSGLLGNAQVDLTRATENFMPELGRATQMFAAPPSSGAGPMSIFSAMFTSRHAGNGAA